MWASLLQVSRVCTTAPCKAPNTSMSKSLQRQHVVSGSTRWMSDCFTCAGRLVAWGALQPRLNRSQAAGLAVTGHTAYLTHLMSSNSPSGGMKVTTLLVSYVPRLTHCTAAVQQLARVCSAVARISAARVCAGGNARDTSMALTVDSNISLQGLRSGHTPTSRGTQVSLEPGPSKGPQTTPTSIALKVESQVFDC
jgi:hypothetical protein